MINPSQINDLVNEVSRKLNLQRFITKQDLSSYALLREVQELKQKTEQTLSQNRPSAINRFPIPPVGGGGGGGGAQCVGLALYIKQDGERRSVWIGAGTIAGRIPSGFNPNEGKFIANGGFGTVFAKIRWSPKLGNIISTEVIAEDDVPQSDGFSFYYALGSYAYTDGSPNPRIQNFGCGSIDATICRNWFSSSEDNSYNITVTRN